MIRPGTGTVGSVQFDRYLDALATDGEAMALAAQMDLGASVAACPGWSVARLLGHTGRIHRWVTQMVGANATERLSRDEMAKAPGGAAVIPWFRNGVVSLSDMLRAAGPDSLVWTFAGKHRAAFWYRRMAQETSIHRWDTERATDVPSPIAADLAADGIDELLEVFVRRARPDAPNSPPGRLHLAATDIDRQWDLAFGETAVAATDLASNLLLFLWGRVNHAELHATGDEDLLRRWQADIQI